MPYLFMPPSETRPMGADRLWSRFHFNAGLSLLKNDGFYSVIESPDDEAVAAAAVAYLGGHVYVIDNAEAADLIAAGFSDWLTAETVPYPSQALYPSPGLYPMGA